MTTVWWDTGGSRTPAVRSVRPAPSLDTCVTQTRGGVSVLASLREQSVRGVSSELGTMTLTEAAQDVSAIPRGQLEVSVMKRLVTVDVWMVLKENIVTDAKLVTTTFPTVKPAIVTQQELILTLASRNIFLSRNTI